MRQGKQIHRWKPWERSTGPKTAAGKARVSRNAYKGGTRPLLRELARILREQQREVAQIEFTEWTTRRSRCSAPDGQRPTSRHTSSGPFSHSTSALEAINGRCLACGYRLAWVLVQGRKSALRVATPRRSLH